MNQSEQISAETAKPESIWALMGNTFTGPLAWLTVMLFIYALAFSALWIFSVVKFFGSEAAGDQILWATVFLAAFMVIISLKLFFWMMMFRGSAMRRLDRIEKRLSELKCE